MKYHISVKDPESALVSRLVSTYGGIQKLADALDCSYRTITKWQAGGRISRMAWNNLRRLLEEAE